MHCLLLSRSVMGNHEGPISFRRSFWAPSHNYHQASLHQAKDNLPQARAPLFCSTPSRDAVPSILCLDLFSLLPWLSALPGWPIVLESNGQSLFSCTGSLNQLWLSHISECTCPLLEQCLELPYSPAPNQVAGWCKTSQILKLPCPVA